MRKSGAGPGTRGSARCIAPAGSRIAGGVAYSPIAIASAAIPIQTNASLRRVMEGLLFISGGARNHDRTAGSGCCHLERGEAPSSSRQKALCEG